MFRSGTTFLLNAASFLGVIAVLSAWERPRHEGRLPPEDLFGAIRAGIRYVRHSRELKTVLVRALSFILCGSAPWALLPLFALKTLGLGPSGYGALVGFFGVGAVAGAFFLPRLRRATSAERVTTVAVLAFAAISLVLGFTRNGKLVGLALGIGGAAWLILLSSLDLAASGFAEAQPAPGGRVLPARVLRWSWPQLSAEDASRGNSITNLVPRPSSDSTEMRPPCLSTMPWEIESPRPVPFPTGFVVKKGSKIRL
jgi:hypothetical protein